jgi:hypothetical protein
LQLVHRHVFPMKKVCSPAQTFLQFCEENSSGYGKNSFSDTI